MKSINTNLGALVALRNMTGSDGVAASMRAIAVAGASAAAARSEAEALLRASSTAAAPPSAPLPLVLVVEAGPDSLPADIVARLHADEPGIVIIGPTDKIPAASQVVVLPAGKTLSVTRPPPTSDDFRKMALELRETARAEQPRRADQFRQGTPGRRFGPMKIKHGGKATRRRLFRP